MKIIPRDKNLRRKKLFPRILASIVVAGLIIGSILVLIYDNVLGGFFLMAVPIGLFLRVYALHRLKNLVLYTYEKDPNSSRPTPFVHNSPRLKESQGVPPAVFVYRHIALATSIILTYTLFTNAYKTEQWIYFWELNWDEAFTWTGATAIYFSLGKFIKKRKSVKAAHQELPQMIFDESEVKIFRPMFILLKDNGLRIEDKYLRLAWSDFRSIEIRSITGQKGSVPEIEIICLNGSEIIIERQYTEKIEHQLLEFVSAYSSAEIILKDQLK